MAKNTYLQQFQVQAGCGLHKVVAAVVICGRDINITCGGGDTYHLGACALAVPRPSLADKAVVSASASVLCVTGHKEDEIARQGALRLAAKFAATVIVACGLHIDEAGAQDIDKLYQNYLTVLEQIEIKLASYFEG